MSLGARLQQVRIRQAISLRDLATRAGLSTTYMADVEAGYEIPSHETLEIWARALEVPFYRLFLNKPEVAQTTLRLGPRFVLDEPEPRRASSAFSSLLEWLRQGVFVLLCRDRVRRLKATSAPR